ncbi:hypothetical protein LY90DRAFT_451711 [Neocallimastix californiae]|uniref:UBC core domain-containing protein n=1 Tax=Neocallimastix californiae TaxID=1754190 RepID=A0A1Y2ERS9_9FUNG|nr:hypothetical protein LY90DRAFT_451711 [Neocallimastix californiae]|eukprot:ORY73974.1 hypothetical protein LY90DRAFT_451711 [Neocallimastix californiae]
MKQLKSSNFFTEDVVCLKNNEEKVGIVIMTTLDDEYVDEDSDVEIEPLQQKHVRVSFMEENEDSRDVNENKLICLDRYLKLGDITRYPVEKGNKQQTGTVINVRVIVDLQSTYNENNEITILKDIDTIKLVNYYDIEEGTCVLLNNWFGIVRDVYDDVYVRFSDGSICIVSSMDIKMEDKYPDSSRFCIERVYPGIKVQAYHKSTFKDAKWVKGEYKPSNTTGYIIMTQISNVYIDWQYKNLKVETTEDNEHPPPFSIKDISSLTILRSIHEYQAMCLGALIQFHSKDEAKDYGVESFNGLINPCFKIIKIKSYVDVQWQDGTITKNIKSTDLLTCYNIDDQDFWPTDFVYLQEEFKATKSLANVKVGVIKSVNAIERVCEVQWLEHIDKESKNIETKEQSIYEISSHPTYTQRLGERVLITTDMKPIESQCPGISEEEAKQDWVGEIVSINDPNHLGKIGVHCCPSNNIHYVFPHQIITISEDEDLMDEDYITISDLDNYEIIEDDKENDKNIEVNDVVIDKDGMEIEVVNSNDDEWITDDDESEWETDEDEEMIDSKDYSNEANRLDDEIDNEEINNIENDTTEDTNNKNEKIKEKIKEEIKVSLLNSKDKSKKLNNFILLEDPPENHQFIDNNDNVFSKSFYKTIMKEHKLLSTELLEVGDIIVAAFSSRLELLRAIIFGPKDTIYEGAVFMFDICIPSNYPYSPPLVHYYSLTIGMGKLNPNLYEDGKVCLSLLGTWHGKDETEEWTPNSNILQVLLSIQGLVLGVQLPYFNEAGYDKLVENSEENFTANYYNERAFYLSVHTINQTLNLLNLSNESIFEIFRNYIIDYYYSGSHMLKYINEKCEKIIRNSEKNKDGSLNVKMEKLETVSKGCLILLKVHNNFNNKNII